MKKTQFKKGQSGNPAGRPKGSGIAGRLRKAINDDADDILQAVVVAAKGGDMQAAKILLDRICPSLKPESQAVDLPELSAGTLTERATAALDAVGRGDLAPDTAAQLINSVGTLARVVELDEMMERISRLENHTGVTDTGEHQW